MRICLQNTNELINGDCSISHLIAENDGKMVMSFRNDALRSWLLTLFWTVQNPHNGFRHTTVTHRPIHVCDSITWSNDCSVCVFHRKKRMASLNCLLLHIVKERMNQIQGHRPKGTGPRYTKSALCKIVTFTLINLAEHDFLTKSPTLKFSLKRVWIDINKGRNACCTMMAFPIPLNAFWFYCGGNAKFNGPKQTANRNIYLYRIPIWIYIALIYLCGDLHIPFPRSFANSTPPRRHFCIVLLIYEVRPYFWAWNSANRDM